jgi:hypothetical protein
MHPKKTAPAINCLAVHIRPTGRINPSDALAAALTNYEDDAGTKFNALCEIEWKQTITDYFGTHTPHEDTDDLNLVSSSKTFLVTIERDLVAN